MKKRIWLLCFLLVLLISISGCGYDPRNNPSLMPNPMNKIAELYCPYAYIYDNEGKYLPDELDNYGREYLEYFVLVENMAGEQKIIYIYTISKEGEIRYTYHMTKNWIRYSEYELSEEEIQQFKEDNCWNEPIENNPKMMLYDDYFDIMYLQELKQAEYKAKYNQMDEETTDSKYEFLFFTTSPKKGIDVYNGRIIIFWFENNPISIEYEIRTLADFENLAEYSQYLADQYFATWEGYVVQN